MNKRKASHKSKRRQREGSRTVNNPYPRRRDNLYYGNNGLGRHGIESFLQEPFSSYGRRPYSSIAEWPEPELFDWEEIEQKKVSQIVNDFGEKIIRVNGEIPLDLEVNDGDRFLFISYDQSLLTHGLHKYPAKFFPELPRWLIYKFSKPGDWILDPFTGSGTVNLEALLARRNSVGIDIDPFSKFLARVKLTPLRTRELEEAQGWLKKKIYKYESNIPSESEFPRFPYRDNWFNKYIIQELTFIKKAILSLRKGPLQKLSLDDAQNITNFFLVCFSSLIRAVSNADNNCTRTVIRKKLKKHVKQFDALSKFIKVTDLNVPKMVTFSKRCPKDVKAIIPDNNDARDMNYPEKSFDLAITSPPYVNAVDYPRAHQLEMYWLGMERGSLASLKRLHIGTETVSHSEYKYLGKIGFKDIDGLLKKIYEKDPRRSFILYKYLADMQENLIEVKRVLKPLARYVIVVGNNKMRGHLVETWKYLTEIAEKIGFKLECQFASEIIRHFIKVPREERIETDWVLVLRKCD